MPINIIRQEIFNNSNIRFNFNLLRRCIGSNIAIVKDLLSDNIDEHVIHFRDEAARIAKPCAKDKHRLVVGMPVVSVRIGDHCYHGLCDLGASVSAIPFSLYE